jgi:hypothetical protein
MDRQPDDLTDATRGELTSHAMLVPWGLFAQRIGLIKSLQDVPITQRTRDHTPQDKLMEFFVATLSGCTYLQDISRGAHPLDQDVVVAQAWGQERWADYSGVSRTMATCTCATVAAVEAVLRAISQPYIDQEVTLALGQEGVLVYDGDLTGRPVSNTSQSYPGAAFGWMDDRVRLGYQAALVSMHSPTYGRLWLSVRQHPGDTVASTQALAILRAAETATGVRPRRRTALLAQRLGTQESLWQTATQQRVDAEARVTQSQQDLATAEAECQTWREQVAVLEDAYHTQHRLEGPHSLLAETRRKLVVRERRRKRREQRLAQARTGVERAVQKSAGLQQDLEMLRQHLAQCEQDNRNNAAPIRAIFRLDAGFGSGANVALLIEMGYDVYTKAGNAQTTEALRRRLSDSTPWTRVGQNAEMVTWEGLTLTNCPYPLDMGLERFQTGNDCAYAVLLHYGADAVARAPTEWFAFYNGRQTIEAGAKEGKGVLQMHHLKVRSAAGLALQEALTAFAANFIRWAAEWLQHSSTATTSVERLQGGVKSAVRIVANTSAWVIWQSQGCLLRFTGLSPFAGTEWGIGNRYCLQLPLPLFKTCDFAPR